MPPTPRDKVATWRTLGTVCRERDWSKPRALYELQNGLPYRTIPPGHTIDWHHPQVKRTLDEAASTVMIVQAVLMADGVPDLDRRTVGIEVLLPSTSAPEPAPAAATSPVPAPPSPRNVSEADLRDTLLAIVKERPNDPLDQESLVEMVGKRLGVPVARDRVIQAQKDHASHWGLRRGRPRKPPAPF